MALLHLLHFKNIFKYLHTLLNIDIPISIYKKFLSSKRSTKYNIQGHATVKQ